VVVSARVAVRNRGPQLSHFRFRTRPRSLSAISMRAGLLFPRTYPRAMFRNISAATAISATSGKPAFTDSRIIERWSDLDMPNSVRPMPCPRKLTLKAIADGTFSIFSPGSIIRGSKFPYELFGCKVGFRFGRAVVWRHDATNVIAAGYNSRGSLFSSDGCAPAPRLSFIGDYRIF
jgi:hypothetical protein